ncbi:MAG: putative metal-binding motif-containing protein [Deltaproteobacteria bacterium]|nr:putative metal-binding motif-containing protein [Deltaproteobacteria bacterium]
MRSFFLVMGSMCLMVLAGCGDDAPPTGELTCTDDAQCDDGVFCNGSETCSPTSAGASSLGCVAGLSPCPANEACIETMATCDDSCAMPDGDGDGIDRVECGGNDCDDMDPDRFPGNVEICDSGHDEDCDLNTVGTLDRDRDGFIDARCSNDDGGAGTDCNDLEASISPLGNEVCNGRDDDCDGDVDEGVSIAGFADADADGRGDSSSMMNACPGTVRFAILGEDCDDTDLAVQPVQNEICDSKDNDCDGTIDENARPAIWYRDLDGDGYGNVNGDRLVQCDVPPGYSLLPTDCNDGDAAIGPLAVEACNAIDDDCNGVADFPVPGAGFEDDDGDGVADAACGGDDCDDLDPFVGAGLPEYCNGRDDDCDGMVDEGLTESDYFIDNDGDGYGTGAAMPMCADVSGMVPRAGDCNDADPGTTPGAVERCDNIDNDCDGTVDENAAAACVGANAEYICIDGFCEIASCTGTYGDCDLRASTGCETELTLDGSVPNCGFCGAPCSNCDAGSCSDTLGTIFFNTTVQDVAGNGMVGIPVWTPLTVPSLSGTTGSGGSISLPLNSASTVIVGGGSCYPTVYMVDGLGQVGPSNTPFRDFSSNVIPLEATELEIIQTAMGEVQQPGRGMVAVVPTISVPSDPIDVIIDRADATPHGFDLPGTPRSLTPVADPRLGGVGVSTTRMVVFGNVEPGPLRVSAGSCPQTESPGRVFPGALTVVTVDCPGG